MKILLATDGSEYSEGAARFLTRFDFSSEDEITVLHVIPEVPFRDYASLKRIKQEVAPRILDSTIDKLKSIKARISTACLDGYPGNTNYLKSDIIAVGSRGIRGAKGMLGSVSRNILGHSECSVLIGK